MTVMEFFGCTFIAYGAPIAMFIVTIAPDPLRIIILIASSFFWLLSLFVSSILWIAVVPLRNTLVFGVVFSVIFQEAFRLLFYILLKRAKKGLRMVAEKEDVAGVTVVSNKHLLAYVCGFGFGIIAGAFSLINVLADMTGPGTIGIFGHKGTFFIASSFLTLSMIFLHTFWGVIFYHGLNKKKYYLPVIVLLSHLLVSCMTLLNQDYKNPKYAASLATAYASVLLTGILAFIIAGGSLKNIKAFFTTTISRSNNINS